MHPFSPSSATVLIDVGASTARVKITDARGAGQVRVKNLGSAPTWIAFGDSSVVATVAGSLPIGSGDTEVFTIPTPYNDPLYVAAIAAAGTGKIYFTPGEGI